MELTERGERILDAASELLLAWGYRRVTIDEIAQRAKVGKGTVYLHWKTKDSLLLAVVLRAKLLSLQRQLERMRADPLEILPSRSMRSGYLDYLGDPVLRALFLDDSAVLGRINDVAKKELADPEQGYQAMRRHLEVLRAHGLVRKDMDVAHQQYVCLATITGFCTSEVLLADQAPDDAETRADILGTTIRSALETSAEPRPEHASVPAPEIIALYERVEELSRQEMRRQLRP
jgi:AcrR family transcriptional regulator